MNGQSDSVLARLESDPDQGPAVLRASGPGWAQGSCPASGSPRLGSGARPGRSGHVTLGAKGSDGGLDETFAGTTFGRP